MRPVARLRTSALVAAVTLVAVLAPACALLPGTTDPSPTPSGDRARKAAARPVDPCRDRVTLRVLTSNELTDINDVAGRGGRGDQRQAGHHLRRFAGRGARPSASGKAAGKYDAVWFASNPYPACSRRRRTARQPDQDHDLAGGLRPGLGVAEVGWDKKAPAWGEIAEAAGQKKFSYGMSNPATSNSAFAALANVATASSGTGTALEANQVEHGGRPTSVGSSRPSH